MNKVLIKNFIKEILTEKSRYERETGQKYSFIDEIKSKITEHPCEYGFTMTTIPKVGLNPHTSYKTPAGVYMYPLNQEYFQKLIDDTLPFVSDAPYVSICKLNWSNMRKWLYFDGTDHQPQGAVDRAFDKVNEASGQDYPKIFDEYTYNARHSSQGTDSKIWDITYFYSQTKEENKQQATLQWNKILRSLGYVGVYDAGGGVIHPSEPMQLVCLVPEAYTVISTYTTQDLRGIRHEEDWGDVGKIKNIVKIIGKALLLKKQISGQQLDYLKKRVAELSSADPEKIDSLSLYYLQEYLENPNFPNELYTILANSKNSELKNQIAGYARKLSDEAILKLASDPERFVRERLLDSIIVGINLFSPEYKFKAKSSIIRKILESALRNEVAYSFMAEKIRDSLKNLDKIENKNS